MIRKLLHETRRRCFHGCCDWRRPHNTSPTSLSSLAYVRIIVAKFLLEVLGAAGAVWGNCDIFLLRTTEEGNRISRIYAIIVGCIFLIRYYWHSKHHYQTGGDFMPPKEHHRRTHRLVFAQIHASKFILQVLGGGGAVWGSSEVLTFRDATTASEWRIASIVVGFLFLIRWMFQISAYCLCLSERWVDPTTFLSTALRFYDAFIVTFILEVLGAAGAVSTLRNAETNGKWRIIASAVGIIFLFRWMLHLRAFIRFENTSTITVKNDDEVKDLDAEIGDLALKESASTDATVEAIEEYPMLNEAIPLSEEAVPFSEETMAPMLRQPSGKLDRQESIEHRRQVSIERPMTPTRETDMQPSGLLHRRQVSIERPITPIREMDMQPSGLLHRQISVRDSPPPSPKHFFPNSPPLRQLDP